MDECIGRCSGCGLRLSIAEGRELCIREILDWKGLLKFQIGRGAFVRALLRHVFFASWTHYASQQKIPAVVLQWQAIENF